MMWAIEGTMERAVVAQMKADDEDFERRMFRIEYTWSIWPRRCSRSQRRVWGRAVRAQAVWTGPGEPIVETRWLHRDEAVLLMIRRPES